MQYNFDICIIIDEISKFSLFWAPLLLVLNVFQGPPHLSLFPRSCTSTYPLGE